MPQMNPYEPPVASSSVPLLWDRSVLIQAGFGMHTLVLLTYCFFDVRSDKPPPASLAHIDPRLDVALFVCALLGGVVLSASAITKVGWPPHLRFCVIGIDMVLLGLLAFVSNGFGTFWLSE